MLSPGTSCTVHSLKARPELNGRRGVVVSQLDEGGRVGVQVEGEAKPLSLKPINLEVVSAPPASSRAGADSAASSVDSKTLARFVTAHSIRASDAAKRQFAEEMRAGVALGGSWCCSSSTLWCVTCAANLAYSGLEDEISDNIPKLLGLAPCTTFRGERITPTLTLTVTLTPTPAPAPNPNPNPNPTPNPVRVRVTVRLRRLSGRSGPACTGYSWSAGCYPGTCRQGSRCKRAGPLVQAQYRWPCRRAEHRCRQGTCSALRRPG